MNASNLATRNHWSLKISAILIACLIIATALSLYLGDRLHTFSENGQNAGLSAGSISKSPEFRSANLASVSPQTSASIAEAYGNLPISFEVNRGQTAEIAKFRSRGLGYDLFLTSKAAILSLSKSKTRQPEFESSPQPEPLVETSAISIAVVAANAHALVEGKDELPGKVNYLLGADPTRWQVNIPTYRKVHYREIYPGVDMVYYGNQRQLEYDFVVAPGANHRAIKLKVEGADKIRIDRDGDLLLDANGEVLTMHKPLVYQRGAGDVRDEVAGRYVLKGDQVSFRIGRFDSTRPLVIDPVLSYSTFFGPSAETTAIAVDAAGNAYLTGRATAGNFPTTPGSISPTRPGGPSDAFVTKLNPTGTALVYSTFLGGTNQEAGKSIAIDSSGNAYVTGETNSSNFPTVNAIRGNRTNFLKSSNGGGNWGEQLIGGPNRHVNVLAINPLSPNEMYAGMTSTGGGGIFKSIDSGATWTNLNAPVPNANCAVLVINPATPSTLYAALNNGDSTVSGLYRSVDSGSSWLRLTNGLSGGTVSALAIDPTSPTTLYAGAIFSSVFKSTNGGDSWTSSNTGLTFGGYNAIAVDPAAPNIVYASAGGGGVFKSANGGGIWAQSNTGLTNTAVRTLNIDSSSAVYAGTIGGGLFKSTNAAGNWSPLNNGLPTFTYVASATLNPANPATIFIGTSDGRIFKTIDGGNNWTTSYETLSHTFISSLALDPGSSAVVYAAASNIANSLDDSEAFLAKLNPNGAALIYSTYLGGRGDDFGRGIAVDSAGNAYVVGNTFSSGFPTLNAFQPALSGTSGTQDAFVSKFNSTGTALIYSTFLGGANNELAYAVSCDAGGNAFVTGITTSTNFPTANAFQATLGDSGFGGGDAFVSKFSTAGGLLYSTYLGGQSNDAPTAIANDAAGNAYVTGSTFSPNFPTLNPIQAVNQGADAFLTKLSPSGSSLIYSTFLGGSGTEFGTGLAVDAASNVYLAGITSSIDFPLVEGTLRTKSPLFKTTNSGSSWTNDNYGMRAEQVRVLVIDPVNTSTIYAGTSSGVFKSTNGGKNWIESNTGLTSPQVVSLVIDPVTPSTLYVGLNNQGVSQGVYKSVNSGASWSAVNNGLNNTFVLTLGIDRSAPNTLYAGVYGSSVFKTTNGGGSWTAIGGQSISFISSIAVDPNSSSIIYGGGIFSSGGVFKSIDGGTTWQPIGTGQIGTEVGMVVVNPATSTTVYAVSNSGVFRSTDSGSNWTQLRTGQGFLAIDPSSPSTLYLALQSGGISPGGLLKSVDGGNSWILVNSQRVRTRTLAIHPTLPAVIYAGETSSNDEDAFVTKVHASGNTLIYSTLLGGSPVPNSSGLSDRATGIAIDAAGHAYVTGTTTSPDFPTTDGVFQVSPVGGSFVSKLKSSYVIRGFVTNQGGTPISGVEVILNGAQFRSMTTEADGSYSFAQLAEGDSFTVSAAKPNLSFTPPSQAFNNLNSDQALNFVGQPSGSPFFTISGRVTAGASGLSGVTVTLSGSQASLTATDANGEYSFTLPGGGSYTVTPSILAHSMTPSSQTFNNLAANQTGNFNATRVSLVVTNANNAGAGSLRQAITDANTIPGADSIAFNIPGGGVKTIDLSVALPDVTESVVIDGSTQPGFAGSPLIEINGAATGSNGSGLKLVASGCTVRGLVLNRSPFAGIWLFFSNNHVIQGNYVGTDPTGTLRRPNHSGILLSNSSNNLIGGTTPVARNLISANNFHGLEGTGAHNKIQGNYIGTDVTGTLSLGNGISGIDISNTSEAPGSINNLIGGTLPGEGNLISGNQTGITAHAPGTIIQGNLIGTDKNGTASVGNGGGILSTITDVLIGGWQTGARNIISGNTGDGVYVSGVGSRLEGNFIGTNISGTGALGNGGSGVVAGNGTIIGGTVPEVRNVISANGGFGNISLGSNSSGSAAVVQGNYIGTDVTGTLALSDLTVSGISISGSNNLIGGTVAGARNVISGNRTGIQIGGSIFPGPVGNLIQGNYIGLRADGNAALPNLLRGIGISDSSNNSIGGTNAKAANRIESNGGPGVVVFSGTGNSITGNSIVANSALGIDLGGAPGITNNDNCDVDAGANNFQNYPVLSSVVSTTNSTTIQGTLNSTASGVFTLDFYANDSCDASGFGEAKTYIGSAPVTTAPNCNFGFDLSLPVAAGGRFITATATDTTGNTSELSACLQASGPAAPAIKFSATNYSVNEAFTIATINVVRSGDLTNPVSVDYATSDNTAQQRTDYTLASGKISFAAGESSKSIEVLISKDAYVEGDETLYIDLSNASGGAILDTPQRAVMTIVDNPAVPTNSQPIDDPRAFVGQHYYDFLNRGPDQGGWDFWTEQITSCGADALCIHQRRIGVSAAFFIELEFQRTGYVVYRTHRASFGTWPNTTTRANLDFPTFMADRGLLFDGPALPQSTIDYANAFVQRPAFLTAYPASQTEAQFVNQLFDTAGLTPYTSERQQQIDAMTNNGKTRAQVLLDVIEIAEFKTREFNRSFVLMQYFGYLRRDPDQGGYDFWLNVLDNREPNNFRGMVCSFITSAEYQQRFGATVTRTNQDCSQ